MSSVEDFCREALRERIAPHGAGNVSTRIAIAARRLGWTHSRTRDAWYGDPRISISGEELADVEELAGIKYGREQADALTLAIRNAHRALVAAKADSPRNLADALIETARLLYRAGD